MTLTTNTYKGMILTIALHYSANMKVQTALLNERHDMARDLLRDYIEGEVSEAQYLGGIDLERLAPHERAARVLTNMHGPRLKREIDEVVTALLP